MTLTYWTLISSVVVGLNQACYCLWDDALRALL